MALHINIEIDTDNSAFEDYPHELERILDDLATRIDINATTPTQYALFDINGNNVGKATSEHAPSQDDIDAKQEIIDHANTWERWQITEALEAISIACYDDEDTDMLRECLIDNAWCDSPHDTPNLKINDNGWYEVLCF